MSSLNNPLTVHTMSILTVESHRRLRTMMKNYLMTTNLTPTKITMNIPIPITKTCTTTRMLAMLIVGEIDGTMAFQMLMYSIVPPDGDGDAYGFVNMSKDRQETITEVEEPIRTVHISLTARGDKTSAYKGAVEAELFGQQRCRRHGPH